MKSLSACLIVKNEEINIRGCLESIDLIVNEIIIVDTGSVDDTVKICSEFRKAKIFQYTWINDFANARNFALSKANSDWIFIIDADERIDNNDYEKILRAIDIDTIEGYYMLTQNYTNNYLRPDFVPAKNNVLAQSYAGWVPSHKTRLFKNKKAYQFSGKIHETVDQSILDAGARLEEIDVPIHHYGNDQISRDKLAFYKKLALEKIEAEPNNTACYYELGQIQLTFGEVDDAIETFQKGLDINPHFGDYRYGNLNYEIGNIYYRIKNDLEKSLEYYLKTIEIRPGYKYVYSMIGTIYRKMKQYHLAETYLQEAILLEADTPNTYHDLGLIQIAQKKYTEAIEYFLKTVNMAPKYVNAYNNIAIAHHLLGNHDEATYYWNEGLKLDPNHSEILGNMKTFGVQRWDAVDDQRTDNLQQ